MQTILAALLLLTGCAVYNTDYRVGRDRSKGYYEWLSSGTYQVFVNCGEEGSSSGSGVVVARDAEGTLIATAAHVADDGCALTVGDQAFIEVASDEEFDVALLWGPRIPGKVTSEALEVYLGMPVIHVGYPAQPLTRKTSKQIATGDVTAFLGDRYKTNAVAYFGSSGGPLFDRYGNLVGLVVALWYPNGAPQWGEIYVTPSWRVYEMVRETF